MSGPHPPELDVLAAVTAQQDGYVTTAQAERLGVGRRRLVELEDRGVVERRLRGIYRVSIGVPVAPRVREDVYERYLALSGDELPWEVAEPPIVASHETAADLLGIGMLPADTPTFTSADRRRTTMPNTRIHQASYVRDDWEWREGSRIPVTSAARTIVDLHIARTGIDYLDRMMREASRRGLLVEGELLEAARRRRGDRSPVVRWARSLGQGNPS